MNWFPVGKEGANVTYTDKAQCEAAEGQACFDISDIVQQDYDVVEGALVLNEGRRDIRIAAEAAAQQMATAESMRFMCDTLVPDDINIFQADIAAFKAKLDAYLGN